MRFFNMPYVALKRKARIVYVWQHFNLDFVYELMKN